MNARSHGQLLAAALAVATVLAGCHRVPPAAVTAPAPTPPWRLDAVTAAIEEPVDDPAALVPADARVYLRLDGLGDLSKLADEDPLAGQVQATLHHLQPPVLWARAAANLDVDDETLLRTYFGKTIAVIDQKVDRRHGVVVLSRASKNDLDRLPSALGMVPWPAAPRIGPFSIWTTEGKDHPLLLAVGRRWLAITETRQAPHLCHLLCGVADRRGAEQTPHSLADTPGFRDLVGALPSPREALLFTRDGKGSERHALGVVREQDRILAHYRAVVPKLAEVAQRFRWSPSLDFGPLPPSILSATAVHVLDQEPEDLGLLDTLLYPTSVRRDLLPHLAPPLVLFLGAARATNPKAREPGQIPFLGAAIRIQDPAVASQLDRLIQRVHFFANLGDLRILQSILGVRRYTHRGHRYAVADFGRALEKRVRDDELRKLVRTPAGSALSRLTFGAAGDWYVICTEQDGFKQWLDAQAAHSASGATTTLAAADFDLQPRPGLLVSSFTRVPELSALLQDVSREWEAPVAPENQALGLTENGPPDPGRQPLRWFAQALRHRHSFSLQFWRESRTEIRGLVRVRIAGHRSGAVSRPAP